jgi:uncharacterized FAD-dependent dehydrogenase
MNHFDVGIIGAGVAGAFCAFKLAKENNNLKTIIFDLGRPPMKRRRQLEGWLGCFPNSDGKLYLNDLNKVANLAGIRRSKSSFNWLKKNTSNVLDYVTIVDNVPSITANKRITKSGFNIELNDYIQIYPKNIHSLSKEIVNAIESNGNITFNFDNEVHKISKENNVFTIQTDYQSVTCDKIIIAAGRSGWRWVNEVYKNFNIIKDNNTAKFGIRVELDSSYLKEFNTSHCVLSKNDITIGPFSWHGTIIPEDHVELAISAFRSNENRWKTNKVSFTLIKDVNYINEGVEQASRIGQLTFILTNDRIAKEKISHIMNDSSKISIMPEYSWLKSAINELSEVIPDISSKAYFHSPTLLPLASKININSNLESDISGMFIVGESAGIQGILSAACTGIIAADSIMKGVANV